LADEWADADKLGVVFGVFDGDLGGEWHGDSLGKSGRCGKRRAGMNGAVSGVGAS
jgi:hypothetical protein